MIFATLLLALPVAPQADAGPKSDHSPLHPAEARLFAQTGDLAALREAYGQTSWGRLLADPEFASSVARMIGQGEGEAVDWRGLVASALQEVELAAALHVLEDLRGVSLSLTAPEGALADALAAVQQGDGQSLHARIALEYGSPESAQGALVSIQALLEPAGLEFQLGLKDAYVWLWSDGAGLDLAQDAPAGPTWAARRGEAAPSSAGATVLEFHSTEGDAVSGWLEGLAPYVFLEGPTGQVLTSVYGALAPCLLRGGTWRVALHDGVFHTSGRYPARAGSPLDEVFGGRPLEARDLALMDPEALVGGSMTLDAPALQAWLAAQLGEARLSEFEAAYGFRPLASLVAPLGDSLQWVMKGNLGPSTPPLVLSVPVTDEETLLGGLRGLATIVEAGDVPGVGVKVRKYRKLELFTLRLEGGDASGLGFDVSALGQPTLAVFDGRLIVATNQTLAKREIKRVRGDAVEGGTLQTTLERFPMPEGAGHLVFGDWMSVLGKLLGLAREFGPMVADGLGLPFDLSALPDAEVVTRHFFASVETRVRTGDLVHYEARSSVGPESSLMTVLATGAAVAWFVPSLVDGMGDSELAIVKSDLMAIDSALTSFAVSNGRYPDGLEMLVAKDVNGKRYIDSATVPKDPWGNEYVYVAPEGLGEVRLWSNGPNGVEEQGAGDDFTLEDVKAGRR